MSQGDWDCDLDGDTSPHDVLLLLEDLLTEARGINKRLTKIMNCVCKDTCVREISEMHGLKYSKKEFVDPNPEH